MSRRLVPFVALFALLACAPAYAAPAISPLLHDVAAGAPIAPGAALASPVMPGTLDLIVSGTMRDADLEAIGGVIGTRCPDGSRTLTIPLASFAALRNVPGLARITASYRCQPNNDVSVPLTNATPGMWTHSGSGVFAGNAGAGVIVGIVDTGIDWSHDDFKKTDGTTRILSLWDQNSTVTPPSGYGYGTEWTAAQINGGSCTFHDTNGHGTHVAGSAAGDGSGTANGQPAYQFWGMAPKADIVAVATDFTTTHILDGVNYVFQKAAALGKNAVVNLSLGNNYGAHDGTETFDTSLSSLTGPGKIVVVSSGNSEGQSLHARQVVAPGGPQTITLNVPSFTANGGTNNDYVVLDAYYPASANMTVTITSPGPSPITVGPIAMGSVGSSVGAAGTIYLENGSTPSPGGDKNVFLQIYDSNASFPPRIGAWTITLTPVSTTASTAWDGWLAQVQLGASGAAATFTTDVDETDLVGSPGSAAQAITVGAFISKVGWPGSDAASHSYVGLTTAGAIANFSSCGPLRNGAMKPDIAAPGTAIVSTKSSFMSPAPAAALVNPDGRHLTMAGTSMAAPHVTGACALLLAATPNQTPAQLKTALAAAATTDAYTGAVPSGVWGNGKLHLLGVDSQSPTAAVSSPNGGETWAAGSSHNITWSASDNVGVSSVALEYSLDDGGSWAPIASGLANSGSYAWSLPQAVSAHGRVRATARDAANNAGADISDAAFTLADQTAPAVTLTSPNGGETWGVGETHDITWSATDNIGVTSVDLDVSSNGGTSWSSIVTGHANDGSYSWNVSSSVSTQTIVRAVAHDAGGQSANDISNGWFVVQPTAGVTNGSITFARPTLVANRPNPFADGTHLGFGLARQAHVSLRLYSLDGRLVRTLADEDYAAGYTEISWDGRDAAGHRAASGIYFCRFEADGVKDSRRLVLQ